MKVISGGQTGVDLAGLEAAEAVGIPTGGFMPAGYRTDEGPRPEYYERFELLCTSSNNYPPRTRLNVKNSDATIIMGNPGSPGCRLTSRLCGQYYKPTYRILLGNEGPGVADRLAEWLDHFEVVNVAGNRESTNPGINQWAKQILVPAFEMWKKGQQ